jgi:hypothetical protein
MSDEVAGLLAKRFISRTDVKAIMRPNGAYTPERAPWTMGDLRAHVAGQRTFGHYMLSTDSKVKLFAYDIDFTKEGVFVDENNSVHRINPRDVWLNPTHMARPALLRELRCMAEGLAARVHSLLELDVAVAYSGNKGMHVYAFTGEIDAAEARDAGQTVLSSWSVFEPSKGKNFWKHVVQEPEYGYPNLEIEVFPKQDSLNGKDLGNLMRLPLGTHTKSGQEGFFVDLKRDVNDLAPMDAYTALTVGDPWA